MWGCGGSTAPGSRPPHAFCQRLLAAYPLGRWVRLAASPGYARRMASRARRERSEPLLPTPLAHRGRGPRLAIGSLARPKGTLPRLLERDAAPSGRAAIELDDVPHTSQPCRGKPGCAPDRCRQHLRLASERAACVQDSYATSTDARYMEIACLIGGRAPAVIVAAAPPARWRVQAPTLERAVSAAAAGIRTASLPTH